MATRQTFSVLSGQSTPSCITRSDYSSSALAAVLLTKHPSSVLSSLGGTQYLGPSPSIPRVCLHKPFTKIMDLVVSQRFVLLFFLVP